MANTMEQLASIVFEIVTDNATEAQLQQLGEVLGTVQQKYARSFMERVKNNVLFAALVEAADYTGAIQFDCSAAQSHPAPPQQRLKINCKHLKKCLQCCK